MTQATIAIIIFAAAFISFILEKIPLAMTCMAGGLAMALTGCMELKDVYSGFGSDTTIMVAAMIFVGIALDDVGLTDMLGRGVSHLGLHKNERVFIFALFLISAFLSAFLSNSAVIAMLIPVIQAMSKAPGSKITQKRSIMPTGMAAGIGGGLTLIGTPPQLVASNILTESGIEGTRAITFWETGYTMLPIVIAVAIYFATIGYQIEKKVLKDRPTNALDDLMLENGATESKRSVPKWKLWFVGAVSIFLAAAFIIGLWDVAIIALIGAVLLISTGCISWKKALRDADWNTIIIVGSSTALATGLNKSGGGLAIAQAAVNLFGGEDASKYVMLVVLVFLSVFLTNFMGNIALVAALVPIALEIAVLVGANPMGYALTCTVACLLAISTPIGTGAVTQTLVGGYKFKDYIKIGLPINLIIACMLCVIAPLVYAI